MKKAIILISCWFMALGVSYSQSYNTYPELNKFKHWSLMGEITFYPKAEIIPQYGPLTIETYSSQGYSVGVEYDIFPANKWSLVTGFYLNFMPASHFRTANLESEGVHDGMYEYTAHFVARYEIPVILSFKQRMHKNIYLDFRTGLRMSFWDPTALNTMSAVVDYQTHPIAREIFGFYANHFQISVHSSYVFSLGGIFDLKYVLLKAHLTYNLSPYMLWSGEYQYGNLLNADNNSRGYYQQSADYFAFSLSFSLKKFKHKLDKQQ